MNRSGAVGSGGSGGTTPERRRALRSLAIFAVAFVAVLAFFVMRLGVRVQASSAATPAPALELRTLEGDPLTLEDFRGRVVLLNFWASWCGPCVREIPQLKRLEERFDDDAFVVLGVNLEEMDAAELARVAAGLGIDYAVLRPVGSLEGWQSNRIPQNYLIDREGRVRSSHTGTFVSWSMQRAVGRLIDESPPGDG